jgi:vacuolar-type H+-ATPase subunit I/STV1
VFRKRENIPFGGVQVILIGDAFQLAPIANFEEWDLLQPYYNSPYFFHSKVIEQNKPIYIELKKIYRQNQQEKINEQNKEIKYLLDKTKDLNEQIERLKSEISVLTAEKANAEKTIQQYQKSVQESKATISKLEAIIISNGQEIERLRNLKWYHKLFRK